MDEAKLLELAIKDLVKLAVKTNKVIMLGTFPGHISDEVYELLRTCENIHTTFVESENDEEDK